MARLRLNAILPAPRCLFRVTGPAALLLALGSCSYNYSLQAVAIQGRLAFVVAPWSERNATCINGIEVDIADGGPTAEPTNGNERMAVLKGGDYWWELLDHRSCQNGFPIFYGQRLRGEPFVDSAGQTSSVVAKPLIIGHVYHISTLSSGSGVGDGWFRITSDRRVENWRTDPLPPVVNSEGYALNVGQRVPPPPNG